MPETYQFVWGEVPAIKRAIALAENIMQDLDYAHIERKDFDLDIDNTGIRIRIPHDGDLDVGRKTF